MNMSRTRRILSGVVLGYANQGLLVLAGLFLTPFLIKRIGQQDYGLWLLGAQIVSYLALIDLGIVALLPREIAYAIGRAGGVDNAADLPVITGQTLKLTLWQTPFVLLTGLILWRTTSDKWPSLYVPLGIILFCYVLLFPLRIFPSLLQGLQDLSFIGKLQSTVFLAATAVTICSVLAGGGLKALAISWIFSQSAITIACIFRLQRRFTHALPKRLPRLPWSVVRTHLTNGIWASIYQTAVMLVYAADVFIIGKILGPAALVAYSCSGKLISVLSNQPQMLMQMAGPALSEMRMSESPARLYHVCIALTQAMLILSGGVGCVVLMVNQGFIGWWVGSPLYGGFLLNILLLAVMLLRHWNTTAVYSIFCFGYEKRITITMILDGLVTVALATALTRRLGPIGAPIGSIVGVCAVSLPLNLTMLARETDVTFVALLKPLYGWFWRFLLLTSCIGVIARIWAPGNFASLAVAAITVASLYTVFMLPIALRSAVGDYLRPRLSIVHAKLGSLLSPSGARS